MVQAKMDLYLNMNIIKMIKMLTKQSNIANVKLNRKDNNALY